MAISTNCCFKFKLPTASRAPPKPQNSWLPQEESRKGTKWPTRVVSIVIGLEMANMVLVLSQGRSIVVRGDVQTSLAMESSKVEVLERRWSEKRVCPPWHLNSLENIVPENLPRPSAKRRFEAIGHGHGHAPALNFVSKCFTM